MATLPSGLNLSFPTIDSYIAQMEGYGKPGTIASNENNPGNITAGSFATSQGATGTYQSSTGQNFAVFPTSAIGTNAEDALVKQYANEGASIQSLISAWSPGNAPGNTQTGTQNYINFLADALGTSPQTSVSQAEQSYDQANSVTTGTPTGTIGTPNYSGPCNVFGISVGPQYCQGNLTGAITGSVLDNITSSSSSNSSISFGRIGAFILGFVFIIGGIFFLKPGEISTVIQKA